MNVELDHNGLVTLVRGCIQNIDQINKLTDEELIRLYMILSRQESKQPEESKGESTIRPIPYESLSADQKDEYDEMIHLEKLRASSDISFKNRMKTVK